MKAHSLILLLLLFAGNLYCQTGFIEITANKTGVNIYLDGQFHAVFSGDPIIIKNISVGNHIIEARKENYVTLSKTITVNDGIIVPVSFLLSEQGTWKEVGTESGNVVLGKGNLTIFVSETGWSVKIDGVRTKKAYAPLSLEDMPAGLHTLVLSKAGQEYTTEINVENGKTVVFDFDDILKEKNAENERRRLLEQKEHWKEELHSLIQDSIRLESEKSSLDISLLNEERTKLVDLSVAMNDSIAALNSKMHKLENNSEYSFYHSLHEAYVKICSFEPVRYSPKVIGKEKFANHNYIDFNEQYIDNNDIIYFIEMISSSIDKEEDLGGYKYYYCGIVLESTNPFDPCPYIITKDKNNTEYKLVLQYGNQKNYVLGSHFLLFGFFFDIAALLHDKEKRYPPGGDAFVWAKEKYKEIMSTSEFGKKLKYNQKQKYVIEEIQSRLSTITAAIDKFDSIIEGLPEEIKEKEGQIKTVSNRIKEIRDNIKSTN